MKFFRTSRLTEKKLYVKDADGNFVPLKSDANIAVSYYRTSGGDGQQEQSHMNDCNDKEDAISDYHGKSSYFAFHCSQEEDNVRFSKRGRYGE